MQTGDEGKLGALSGCLGSVLVSSLIVPRNEMRRELDDALQEHVELYPCSVVWDLLWQDLGEGHTWPLLAAIRGGIDG